MEPSPEEGEKKEGKSLDLGVMSSQKFVKIRGYVSFSGLLVYWKQVRRSFVHNLANYIIAFLLTLKNRESSFGVSSKKTHSLKISPRKLFEKFFFSHPLLVLLLNLCCLSSRREQNER